MATRHPAASPELRRLGSKYSHLPSANPDPVFDLWGQQPDIKRPFKDTVPMFSQRPAPLSPGNRYECSQNYHAEVGPQEKSAVERVPLEEPTSQEVFDRSVDWLLESNNRC